MTVDIRLANARDLLALRRFGEVLSLLHANVDMDAGEEVLSIVAEAMAGLNMSAYAASVFERAAALGQPNSAALALRAAELYLAAGEIEQAQLIGLRLLGQTPDDPALAFLLISTFEASGELHLTQMLVHRLVPSENVDHLLMAARLLVGHPEDPANRVVFRKLRRLLPEHDHIRFVNLAMAREACDFETVEREEQVLRAEIAARGAEVLAAEKPHNLLIWMEDETLLPAARGVLLDPPFSQENRTRRHRAPHVWAERLRIGYVSADLWDDHATMRLLGEVLTCHDRSKMDITLFCNTPEKFRAFDGGARATWGRIVSIVDHDDDAAEQAIRRQGIDILVDLKGYTANNRSGLFNRGLAPVQVAWLGFPGTANDIDCDYIIGDRFTLPDESAPYFFEHFCRLPETYQPNETLLRPRPPALSRRELGLPEDAFLFSSFNSPRKLTPATLDIWAEVLKAAPDAHLAVMAAPSVQAALAQRGIRPERVHPLRKCAYRDHIARAAATDLALDTFPCNGHTTTSDMLWAGVPVVTRKGHSFAARVSESLLNAIGLEDLVADDAAGFVRLAADLANDRSRVHALKARLEENRFRMPLFDAERFCRHLESAYLMMAERARAGLPPATIDVPAHPPRNAPFRLSGST